MNDFIWNYGYSKVCRNINKAIKEMFEEKAKETDRNVNIYIKLPNGETIRLDDAVEFISLEINKSMTKIDKMINNFKLKAKTKQNIDKTIENEYVNKKDLIDYICQVTGYSYFSSIVRAIIEFPKSR